MSSDQKAFALSSVGGYLIPSVDMSDWNQDNISVISLTTTSQVTDYDKGDYTSWFSLNNNRLVSLLTKSSFYVNTAISSYCNGGTAYETYGSQISQGTVLEITKV